MFRFACTGGLEGMDWVDIQKRKPKQKQDCIVLTATGSVRRAMAHKEWLGGFCEGDGKDGLCVADVTHWLSMQMPSNAI